MDAMTLTPEWQSFDTCPSCHRSRRTIVGRLGIYQYLFGSRRIPLPPGGVPVATCDACGLTYKVTVPTTSFLKLVTALEQSGLWQLDYDFESELAAIRRHHRAPGYDLLDIGAAGGEFLAAATASAARRSALDIVRFDRLAISDDGEFIRGFLDDSALAWSGRPYDVVTAFDILEHVYAPTVAMENLHAFTKPGGIVIIETGDTDSVSARALGQWYYLGYFEHHVAWNARAVAAIAERFDFDVLTIERKRHKLIERKPFDVRGFVKYGFFKLSPRLYHALQYWGGYDGSTPSSPSARDHIRITLRRR